MHIPVTAFLGGAAAIILLLAGGAMAGAYFRANWGQSTIDLLTKDNAARGERIDTLEKEKEVDRTTIFDLKATMDDKVTTLSANLAQSSERIKDLTELVTGATAVHALGTELSMQVETRMNELGSLFETYTRDLRQAIREQTNLLSQRLTGVESALARVLMNPPEGVVVHTERRNLADPLDLRPVDVLVSPDFT